MPTGAWLYSYVALWVLLLLECLALMMLVRQMGRLYSHWIRNDPEWGLPLGSRAPALPEADIYGRPVSLAVTRERKTVLFFLSPGCRSCKQAILRACAIARHNDEEVVLVVRARELRSKLFVSEHLRVAEVANVSVIADPDRTVSERYKVAVVPYIVVVDTDGRVGGKGAGLTLTEIGLLVRQADHGRLSPRREPVPPVVADNSVDGPS